MLLTFLGSFYEYHKHACYFHIFKLCMNNDSDHYDSVLCTHRAEMLLPLQVAGLHWEKWPETQMDQVQQNRQRFVAILHDLNCGGSLWAFS